VQGHDVSSLDCLLELHQDFLYGGWELIVVYLGEFNLKSSSVLDPFFVLSETLISHLQNFKVIFSVYVAQILV